MKKATKLKKYNIDLIRIIGLLYLSKTYSLHELSNKFSISYNTLKYHSQVNGFFLKNYNELKAANTDAIVFSKGKFIAAKSCLMPFEKQLIRSFLPTNSGNRDS